MGSPVERFKEYESLKVQGRELAAAAALEMAKQMLDRARESLEEILRGEMAEVTSLLHTTSKKLVDKNLALGETYLREGNLELAREHFTIARDVAATSQDRDEASIRLGQVDQREAPRETLEKLYEKLRAQPDSPELIYDFATTLAMEGYVPEAIRHLERLLELTPDDADVYYRLGNACVDARRYDEARVAYERALEKGFEDEAEIFYRQGWLIFDENADHAAAKKYYRRGLEQNERHIDCLKGLAHLNELEDDPEEAIELYNRASQVDPEDMEVRLQTAELHRQLRQYDKALDVCEKALQAEPEGDLSDEIRGLIDRVKADQETELETAASP